MRFLSSSLVCGCLSFPLPFLVPDPITSLWVFELPFLRLAVFDAILDLRRLGG